MNPAASLTVAVLAGGHSRRMGRDKAALPLGPERLLQRVVRRLRPYAAAVLVVARTEDAYPWAGAPVVADRYPERGPLGGIATALHHAVTPLLAAVACDMPFVSGPLLHHLARHLLQHPHDDIALPRDAHDIQPLHAVYRVERARPAFVAALARPRASIRAAFRGLRVRVFPAADLAAFDPARAFWNINTPADYRALREALGLPPEPPAGPTEVSP